MHVVVSIGEALGDCWLSETKGKNVDCVDDADDVRNQTYLGNELLNT